MSIVTKEWLLTTIAELEEERDAVPGAVNEDAARSLDAMKLALASIESEAVAYIFKHPAGRLFWSLTDESNKGQSDVMPVYTAPPAPVSDSLLSELLGIAKRAADEADECAHAEFSDDSMGHSAAIADWERRASMLQGAERVSNRDELTDAVNGLLAVMDEYPETLVPINRDSAVVRQLRVAAGD